MFVGRFAVRMLLAFAACVIPIAASAHPLGNFTINHLARIESSGGALHVRYVLDIAEIPSFQIMHERPSWDAAARASWSESERERVERGLHVTVDGAPVTLAFENATYRLRPGAGGLPTLYWSARFDAPLTHGNHRVAVVDDVYADRRIGWKDIVAGTEEEPTQALTRYPSALLGSPRRVSSLTFDLSAAGAPSRVVTTEDALPDVNGSASIVRSNALSDMFVRSDRTPWFVLLTVLVAFGLGALHAIEPGHGKALLAFTLVGSRATVKQAAILAASLTFAHTAGVFVLGAILFFAAGFASESIYAWITLLSGAAVAVIGARNLNRTLQRHSHDGRAHSHAFASDHHHGDEAQAGHSHAIPGEGPIDFRGAVVAAMSGGVAPCPAAIVVMLAALRLHQVGYGLALIVIFSLGLATVLSALGIAVVHGAAWLGRNGRFERVVAAGPLISALLISIVGAVMVGQGFAAQGVRAPAWAIALLCIVAIAGYAAAPAHSHARASSAGRA